MVPDGVNVVIMSRIDESTFGSSKMAFLLNGLHMTVTLLCHLHTNIVTMLVFSFTTAPLSDLRTDPGYLSAVKDDVVSFQPESHATYY